jgi:methyl acetate hydrolase
MWNCSLAPPKKWGLSFMINVKDTPSGRSSGSLFWGGLFNTYYWLDPERKLAGTFMTQVLPFADTVALECFEQFETLAYQAAI